MKLMAFSKTVEQIRNRTKTVTRRDADTWKTLKPGDLLQAVAKGQGLRKGEKVARLAVIRVVDARLVMLGRITPDEIAREGFPGITPGQFMNIYGGFPKDWVRRIEFEYVDDDPCD